MFYLRITKFINIFVKYCLIFTAFIILQPSLHAQTVTAPNQCSPTPLFPIGTVGAMCPEGTVPISVYAENFDEGFGGFSEDPAPGSFNDLTVSTAGDTPSSGTGPETTASCNASTNEGEFIFLEGSSTLANEDHCMSNTVDLTNASAPLGLSVWYHMFGDNIGDLEVKINGSSEFSVSGQQQTENGQAWRQATLNLDSYAGSMVDVQICMSEGDGNISTFESDISVDQLEVYSCEPPDTSGDILDFLPAILATVEKRPPPPPPSARWRIANAVVCDATFFSEWTVSDGVSSRKSLRRGFFDDPDISAYVTVVPGDRTFTGTLRTSTIIGTCGTFVDTFTRQLKPGYDYRFVVEPSNGGTDTTIRTFETQRVP